MERRRRRSSRPKESTGPGTATSGGWPAEERSVLAYLFLFAITFAAIFLTGSHEQGALGVLCGGAGLLLICFPPTVRIRGSFWLLAGLLMACSALSLLHQAIFPVSPLRRLLETEPVIPLGSTVSLEPRATLFWGLVLGASLLTGLFALSQKVGPRGLVLLVQVAVLASAVYAALSLYAAVTGWKGDLYAHAPFGFFPNRNHTAIYLVLGAILSMGLLLRPREHQARLFWIFPTLALLLFVPALLFYSSSRAGVVLLGLSVPLYLLGCGRGSWKRTRTLLLVGAALYAAIIFLASGSEVQQRMMAFLGLKRGSPAQEQQWQPEASKAGEIGWGVRRLFYQDTLRMVKDYPWTGVGMGLFAPTFAHYRTDSLMEAQALHPESDWLLMLAEVGWPAVLCLLALLGLLFWQGWSQRSHPSWPLRYACLLAALVAALHGFVDVPTHRLPLGWWIILLGALGCQGRSSRGEAVQLRSWLPFLAGGVGMCLLGYASLCAEWAQGEPLPPFAPAVAGDRLLAQFRGGHYEEARRTGEEALRQSPAADRLCFQLGAFWLNYPGEEAKAAAYFRAQRLLDPIFTNVPLAQARLWLGRDLTRVPLLLVDALQRQNRVDPTGRLTLGLCRQLLGESLTAPFPRAALLTLLRAHILPGVRLENQEFFATELQLLMLTGATAAEWNSLAPADLTTPEYLQQLTTGQRRRLFREWWSQGDREALRTVLKRQPQLEEEAWMMAAEFQVAAGQEASAVALAFRYLPSPALPKIASVPLVEAMGRAAREPENYVAQYQLYSAQAQAQDWAGAVKTLEQLTSLPSAPSYLPYLRGISYAALGDDHQAWESLKQYGQSLPESLR